MSKISGQLLISGQFQDISEISGISRQLGALILLWKMSAAHLCHLCAKKLSNLVDI